MHPGMHPSGGIGEGRVYDMVNSYIAMSIVRGDVRACRIIPFFSKHYPCYHVCITSTLSSSFF